jgi:hypothetical protein
VYSGVTAHTLAVALPLPASYIPTQCIIRTPLKQLARSRTRSSKTKPRLYT